jgi:hypothetical protein
MTIKQPIVFEESSRDWYHEPRTFLDVIRCRLGWHQRITRAQDGKNFVSRCSCGGLEFDRDGYWMDVKKVGRRKGKEKPEGLTWRCMVCNGMRPDAKISVAHKSHPLIEDPFIKTTLNVRYCNDRPDCINRALAPGPWKG